jgi:very-short-patch-repair endonuclease
MDLAITTHLDIPVTTPARTIVDLAATMYSDQGFRRVVHEAQVQEKVTIEQLQREVRPGRPGARRLAVEIADGAKPTRSGFEDRVVELLRGHHLPRFETNVHPPGTPQWVEVDVLFPNEKLVIEVDGARYHSTRFRKESDASKRAILEAAGYRVLRVGEGDDVVALVLLELGR